MQWGQVGEGDFPILKAYVCSLEQWEERSWDSIDRCGLGRVDSEGWISGGCVLRTGLVPREVIEFWTKVEWRLVRVCL